MSKVDDLTVVAATMRRARSTQAALSILALLSTVLWFALWRMRFLGVHPAADLAALLFCIGSGWLAARFIAKCRAMFAVETSPLYRLLEGQPESLLWIFPQPVHLRIGPFRPEIEQIMTFLTKDGKAYKMRGVTRSSYPKLEKALRHLAPHARYGWSEKNRQFYQHQTGLVVR